MMVALNTSMKTNTQINKIIGPLKKASVLWYNKRDGFGQLKTTQGERVYFSSDALLESVNTGDSVLFLVDRRYTNFKSARAVIKA